MSSEDDRVIRAAQRNKVWDALVDAADSDVELRMALEKISPFVFLRMIDAIAGRL